MILVVAALMMPSCVSKKKYRELDASRLATEQRENDLKKQLADTEAKAAELENEKKEITAKLEDTGMSKAKLDDLLKEKAVRLEEREKTIKDLRELIEKQKNIMDKLLSKVQNALVSYDSTQLSVEVKNGKVYVAMSDQLLFASGSTFIDKKGQAALQKLAEILSKQTDIDILVEGHTDSVPIKSKVFKDNWDLSVFRATAVVRILTEYNVDKAKLIPSGRGEFSPVGDNATADGRAKNRRTEIILSPNLDELYKLLNS